MIKSNQKVCLSDLNFVRSTKARHGCTEMIEITQADTHHLSTQYSVLSTQYSVLSMINMGSHKRTKKHLAQLLT